MPLIQTKAQQAALNIINHIDQISASYEIAVRHLNLIIKELLVLNNTDLAEFGNNLGPVEMGQLTTLHGLQGDGVNQLVESCNLILNSVGRKGIETRVDVRPLATKLAEQQREIYMDGSGIFTIRKIAYPPEILTPIETFCYVNQPFSIPLVATNEPESFIVTGLPDWLKQDGTVLNGTPDTVGTYEFDVEALGLRGVSSGVKTIGVVVAEEPVIIEEPPVEEPVVEETPIEPDLTLPQPEPIVEPAPTSPESPFGPPDNR